MNTIKKEVKKILMLCNQINRLRYDDPDRKNAENVFWQRIQDLNDASKGLVGKHVRFLVADGYAHYIVVKDGKSLVTVEHIPLDDAYEFGGVYDGKILRGIVESQISWTEGMRAIMAKK